jgi:hypothetical protein
MWRGFFKFYKSKLRLWEDRLDFGINRSFGPLWVAHFIHSYHAIRDNEVHDDLQNDLFEKWWRWNSQQNMEEEESWDLYVNLYVQLYLINILFIYIVTTIKYNLCLNFMLCLILIIEWMLEKEVCRVPDKLLSSARIIFGCLELLRHSWCPKHPKVAPKNLYSMTHVVVGGALR